MKKIWKFDIPFTDGYFKIEMPKFAEVLHFDWQLEDSVDCLEIWAEVDPTEKKEKREFILVGTGHEIPYGKTLRYIGTTKIELGRLMYHLYEVVVQRR